MVIIEFLFTPHPENVDVRSRENTTRRFGNVYLSKSVGDTTSLELGVYAQTVIKGFDEKRPGTVVRGMDSNELFYANKREALGVCIQSVCM